MGTLSTVLQLFAGLSFLIILHELGHFLAAKFFGVRVIKFYLFFDFLFPFPEVAKFALFKKQIGDTEYGLGWFPFGGYVQMAGIMDESMDAEAMKLPPQPDEFRSKPAWQRLIILLGGIIVNILVAFVLYGFIAFTWGDSYLKVQDQVYGIYCDSTALELGLKNGDIITHVNGKEVEKADKVKIEMLFSLADNITYLRDGQEGQIVGIDKLFYKNIIDNQDIVLFETALMCVIDSFTNDNLKETGIQIGDQIIGFEGKEVNYQQDLVQFKKGYEGKEVALDVLRGEDTLSFKALIDAEGMLGFAPRTDEFIETTREYNFLEALVAGPVKTWSTLKFYVAQFKLMFDPVVKGYRQIGGFGTMAKLYSGGFSWYAFLSKTAFISIILAFMNLLPIPALDGGHAMFAIYEMIFRRPAPEKVIYYAQLVGMVILFGLLIFANGNDIIRGWFN